MNNFLRTAALLAFCYLFTFTASAQNLKFDELKTSFTAQNYPEGLFEMVEAKGFYRVDKQYLPYCDRVIYAYVKNDRPVMFVNPVVCPKPQRSEIFPMKVKNELELQYQKTGRPQFESLHEQIRKTCKALPDENGTVPGPKSKTTKRAYRHEASGITFVVINTAPVAYIYLLK
ncbi:hypothetical protein I5M27_03460 [Adhaeribacter sp. BT258]|uniref:Uncharacterized protein n=1 Tax=Adhaeribacter terrigena TaxID=2793070 RepID=A0ABS1BXZ6_9BACT|nr:hypothetical protein [Adhaeribacter terrigena]MBK0402027.1 hypothetical protein [Adhaeribacter terrigena]